jgi:hypothetical protein
LISVSSIEHLHNSNLIAITNYLARNNLAVPNNVTRFYNQPSALTEYKHVLHKSIDNSHPLHSLRRLLTSHQLTMVPADKTKQLTILQSITLNEELGIHLTDKETYEEISFDAHERHIKDQQELVANAIRIYKDRTILNKNPSGRYIYFLPKIHKPIHEWRTRLHPKMRPIISDRGSITFGLARYLLPPLQKIERDMHTAITSSIAAAFHIQEMNTHHPFTSYNLTTFDVESLFTRIPQDRLIDIIATLLPNSINDAEQRIQYMKFLSKIIKCNTFEALGKYYIQKIGVPMGMPLSGTLANIYLGYIEKEMEIPPSIPIFIRYVDDGFMLSRLTADEMQQFLDDLSNRYHLKITSTMSNSQVNYLDMTIRLSASHQTIQTLPFTKNPHHLLPLPNKMVEARQQTDIRIINSQLLRIWRISNNSSELSKFINNYLISITQREVRNKIFQYLAPIKTSTHRWSAEILLCESCNFICISGHIHISKITKVYDKYVATNFPMNCKTMNVYIIIRREHNNTQFTRIHSLHHLLSLRIIDKIQFTSLTPFHFMSFSRLRQFLEKHPSLNFQAPPSSRKTIYPCHIHQICKKPHLVYGINSGSKKNPSIEQYFNFYKKFSRGEPNTKPAVSL